MTTAFQIPASLEPGATAIRATLTSYARVLFLHDWKSGLLFFGATVLDPMKGALGLCGLLSCELSARLFGMPHHMITEGFFAINGLLIGLAMGLFFAPSLAPVSTT